MNVEELSSPDEVSVWLKEYNNSTDDNIKGQLRNLIVLAYLPFVKKISHGLARRSTDPVEDLIQIGSVGLLKAIDQFDASMGTSFKTYATYLITGEIRHYLRDKTTMIRAPRELQELSFRINQLVQRLTLELERSPTDLEVAEALEIPIEVVEEVSQIDRRKQMLSLDQVISNNGDNEQSLVEKLVDDKYQDFLLAQEDRIMLAEAVEILNDPLKEVIKLSFFEDMSQNEIAKRLGISQMQVSRRLKKALSQLFETITKKKSYLDIRES